MNVLKAAFQFSAMVSREYWNRLRRLQQYTLLNFNLPRWMESPTKHLCLGAEDKDDKKKKKKVLSEGTVWEKVKKSHKSESIAAGLQNGHIW